MSDILEYNSRYYDDLSLFDRDVVHFYVVNKYISRHWMNYTSLKLIMFELGSYNGMNVFIVSVMMFVCLIFVRSVWDCGTHQNNSGKLWIVSCGGIKMLFSRFPLVFVHGLELRRASGKTLKLRFSEIFRFLSNGFASFVPWVLSCLLSRGFVKINHYWRYRLEWVEIGDSK